VKTISNPWMEPLTSFCLYPFAFCLLLLLGTGCSSQHSSLTLQPAADESRVFTQVFPQAYVTRSEDGEFEAVLIDDGIDAVHDPKPGKPLESSPMTPVTQVVHIRVFWRPLPGTLADHPSATNAALDWYVISDGAERGDNLLHYSGAGFVTRNRNPAPNSPAPTRRRHGRMRGRDGNLRLSTFSVTRASCPC